MYDLFQFLPGLDVADDPASKNGHAIRWRRHKKFLAYLEKELIQWRAFSTLAIYGGFRRGELLGLQWKDIDFETGVVTIKRTSLYTKKGMFTDTPKTKGSIRSLKLPDGVISLLSYKAHRPRNSSV